VKIVRAAWVYPVSSEPLCDGAVVVEGERIRALGPAADMLAAYPRATLVDLGESALLPAAVNAHTHLELTAMAGAVPSQPFVDWILALTVARRALAHEDFTGAAREGVRMLQESGTSSPTHHALARRNRAAETV